MNILDQYEDLGLPPLARGVATTYMKPVSETRAISELESTRRNFRKKIQQYEVRAASCSTCTTPGACCLDAHFVNVRITRLEASAIKKALETESIATQQAVKERVEKAIEKYGLEEYEGDPKYACPLFEKETGCLVHTTAKPLPCVAHACYENHADEPPSEFLNSAERSVGCLSERVYGRASFFLPIPVAIRNLRQP